MHQHNTKERPVSVQVYAVDNYVHAMHQRSRFDSHAQGCQQNECCGGKESGGVAHIGSNIEL